MRKRWGEVRVGDFFLLELLGSQSHKNKWQIAIIFSDEDFIFQSIYRKVKIYLHNLHLSEATAKEVQCSISHSNLQRNIIKPQNLTIYTAFYQPCNTTCLYIILKQYKIGDNVNWDSYTHNKYYHTHKGSLKICSLISILNMYMYIGIYFQIETQ